MKTILRYQSQLLYRRSYKPQRQVRVRTVQKLNATFHPVHRFGMKPRLEFVL
ncbi:MAG TPA: hypothetical protein VGN23_01715 [Verrucomicrobiae bacterium]